MERDSKKRSYDEMSATEQQLLQDFDEHTLQKHVDKTSLRIEKKPFVALSFPNSEPHEEHRDNPKAALLQSMLIIVLHRNRVCSTCLSHKSFYRAFASLRQSSAPEHACILLVRRRLVIWIPNSSVST